MANFKMMKVFDCQDMPEDIRKIFFDYSEKGNDVYVDWWVHSERYFYLEGQDKDPEYIEYVRQKTALDDWFIANGATPGKPDHEGEHIIVKHWW